MAVIGKIRQRSGLLIFLIGLSIVGFLVMDATNSQGSILRGRPDSVGEVNGVKIGNQEFEDRYSELVKQYEDQMRGQPLSDDMRNSLRGMTWEQMVNDVIFEDVYKKLGINVTGEELAAMTTGTEYTYPGIVQSFTNPQTGQFDAGQVRVFLDNLDKDDPGVEPGTRRNQWLRFEDNMKKEQFQTKYQNLISKGLYVATWEGEMAYNDQGRLSNFKYVELPYTDVKDADLKITDDELKKYIEEHPARFKREDETRKVQYVTFDIVPSAEDSAATIKALEDKREEFAKGNTVSQDSEFVKMFSETAFDEVYYTKDNLFSSVKDTFFTVPVNTIVGPYIDGNQFKLAKVSDRKAISDSVKVREIVLSFSNFQQGQEALAQAKRELVDSIFKQIDSLKGDFTMFAMMYSDDQVSKMQGGNIGWVKQNDKPKEYNDFLFYRAVKGKTYKVPVASDNAWHIFQVVEDKPSKTAVLVTYLSRAVLPSAETEKNIFSAARTFESDNQTAAKYKEAAKKLNVKTVGDMRHDQFSVVGLGNAREMVKWAFTAKKDEVSAIFTMDKKHVIAYLEEIYPKGLKTLEEVREVVKAQVARDKKFEILAKKFTDAGAGDIDQLAGKVGASVAMAEKANFGNPSINGLYEPKVVGASLTSPVGKLSKPIEGNAGVFVLQTLSIEEPAKTQDYSPYIAMLKNQVSGKARSAGEVQKKLATIVDTRSDFF